MPPDRCTWSTSYCWITRPIDSGRRHAALLGRSFNHWRRPERAFELAHELVRGASVWHLGRGTPTTAAAQLVGLLSA